MQYIRNWVDADGTPISFVVDFVQVEPRSDPPSCIMLPDQPGWWTYGAYTGTPPDVQKAVQKILDAAPSVSQGEVRLPATDPWSPPRYEEQFANVPTPDDTRAINTLLLQAVNKADDKNHGNAVAEKIAERQELIEASEGIV